MALPVVEGASIAALIVYIIVFAAIAVGLVLVNIIFIAKFSDPVDRFSAWIPKLFVLLGLTFAFWAILLLPFDKCTRPWSTSFMPLVWQIVFLASAGLALVVLPFTLYYYESFDDTAPSRCCGCQLIKAIIMTLISLLIFVTILIFMWYFLGKADINLMEYYADEPINRHTPLTCHSKAIQGLAVEMEIPVSIAVYAIALLSFFGWFLFILYGGVGLTALPMDLITDFATRPRKLSSDQYLGLQQEVRKSAEELQEELLKFEQEHSGRERYSAKLRNQLRKLEGRAEEIENNFKKLNFLRNPDQYNPLIPWLKLIVGIFGILISIAWLAHIIIFQVAKVHPFLNAAFEACDNALPFLGVALYGVFVAYLLWATVKGNIKLGLNFLLLSIHPMKLNATLMNSFLFNTILIIFCVYALLQFCTSSFSVYARGTAVSALFDQQMRHLKFLKYFFNYFIYAFLGVAALSLIVSLTVSWCLKARKRRRREEKNALKDVRRV
eukprot:gnl/Trimastix_PCT/1038.p1 GENE.gnl/Trimastix_PCT/1038~~gnl/Trimastix_PCT/1038.p1  ORF type:complete len:513 (+),score=177.59 gnl/Trimastix_PCT/1038:53-1540(+)